MEQGSRNKDFVKNHLFRIYGDLNQLSLINAIIKYIIDDKDTTKPYLDLMEGLMVCQKNYLDKISQINKI